MQAEAGAAAPWLVAAACMALMPPALLLFYVFAVDRLGFLLTAGRDGADGARWRWARGWRLAIPLAHRRARCSCISLFSKLLRVPLPPGLLPTALVRPGMSTIIEAFGMVFQTDVLIAILLASIYGLVVGLAARPVGDDGDGAAGAGHLLSLADRRDRDHHLGLGDGDLLRRHPGRLLRIPGTPASAAYTDEAYAMTRKGQPEMALGIGLWFSALGGIAGTLSLMVMAPPLAEMALQLLDLRVFLAGLPRPDVRDAGGALLAGQGDRQHAARPAGLLRRHRESGRHAALHLRLRPICSAASRSIPALVGVFAVSEVMRAMLTPEPPKLPVPPLRQHPQGPDRADASKYVKPQVRGNIVGIIIGVLPGAGADMAAWVSYCDVEALLQDAGEVRHRAIRKG